MDVTFAGIHAAEDTVPQHVQLGTTLKLADTCIRKIAVPKKIIYPHAPFFKQD
jgi:hypothetical protein